MRMDFNEIQLRASGLALYRTAHLLKQLAWNTSFRKVEITDVRTDYEEIDNMRELETRGFTLVAHSTLPAIVSADIRSSQKHRDQQRQSQPSLCGENTERVYPTAEVRILVQKVCAEHADTKVIPAPEICLRGFDSPLLVAARTGYSKGVHTDYTGSFEDLLQVDWIRQALKDTVLEAQAAHQGPRTLHIKILGMWRPVCMTNPVADHPLAFCDRQSVDVGQDLVVCEAPGLLASAGLRFNLPKFNAKQRWCYFSGVRPGEEVIVWTHFRGRRTLKDLESDDLLQALGPYEGGGTLGCPVVPHCAFSNPDCPRTAERRKSAEIRVLLLRWGD